jgi:hypothetical protein
MSVTYTGSTTSYGPDRPTVTTLALGVPTAVPSIIDNTSTQAPTWQFVNGKMAVMNNPDKTMDGVQQGTPALTNVTAVTLAGYAVGSCSFVQTTGAYRSS